MKIYLLLCFVIFGSFPALAQDWYFAGVRVYHDVGTVVKHGTQYGYSWIRRDDQKTDTQKQFKIDTKATFPSANFTFKHSKSYNFVAVYKIEYMGEPKKGSGKKKVSYYKFYAGKTVESIEKSLASDTKLYSYVSTARVELIDLQKKKAELNQQNKNPVLGRSIH